MDRVCQTCGCFVNNNKLVSNQIVTGPRCVGNSVDSCECWMPMITKNPIGEMAVKITINKDEILRDLEEIRKKAEEVSIVTVWPPYPLWAGYPYFTWETPNITIATTVSGGTGETTTNADASSTPTGD